MNQTSHPKDLKKTYKQKLTKNLQPKIKKYAILEQIKGRLRRHWKR
jgi:hypothetical protein